MKFMFILFGIPIIVCTAVTSFFFVLYLFNYIFYRYLSKKSKITPIKSNLGVYKQHNILRRLFIDFPKQLARDKLTINPNTFKEYGLHLICGMQGSGKTTTMAYLTRMYKRIYPNLRVVTNYGCPFQDEALTDWKQLTLNTNGIYGELDCISEIQNWFDTNASRNFPPNMLSIITQQRKVRRAILADTQVFTRIAKPIRENTYLLYYPFTFCGCVTFVRVYLPILDHEGNLKEKKLKKFFFFVHDKELREMFDSYAVVDSFAKSGFNETKIKDV